MSELEEKFEAEELEWGQDQFKKSEKQGEGEKSYVKVPYMSFSESGTYKVRLVGNVVKFLKHWKPFPKGARIITAPQIKDSDPAWAAGFYPRKTGAVLCFDRNDNNTLKILEKGMSIFRPIDFQSKVKGINPGGKDGVDIIINVEKTGPEPMDVEYSVLIDEKAPLTKAEGEAVKKVIGNKKVDQFMKERYASTPLKYIISEWEKIPEERRIKEDSKKDYKGGEKKGVAEKSSSGNTPPPKTASAAQQIDEDEDDDDDLFGDEDDSTGHF